MAKPMYYWNGTAWEAVAPVVPQSPIAYQASAPSTPSTGDLWIDSDQDLDSYQRQLVRYKFNATGGETSLSGTDANGATLSYTPGAEQVYLNGALLVRGSDYVATDGTSITSLAALASSDVVEIFAYVAFNPANTYTQSQVDGLVGLVHLHTETFSAASSVSINDVFSANYKAYKIILDHSASTTLNTTIRLRVGGSDDSNANYLRQYLLATGATVSGGRVSAQTSWTLNAPVNNRASAEFLIINPFETLATTAQCINAPDYTSNNLIIAESYAYTTTTSFTGFSLIASTGNITGFVSVYGYK